MDKKILEQVKEAKKRLKRVKDYTASWQRSEMIKALDNAHITLINPPIKKTNVILKNVNFQYAVKLWNYMQTHMEDDTKKDKGNNDYYDDGKIKKLIDESFLLDYLVLDSIGKEEEKVSKTELSEKLVGNMIEKVITMDSTMDEKKLKDLKLL